MRHTILPLFLLLGITTWAQPAPLRHFRANEMVRGYFYAASKGPASLNGAGGWGGSSNAAQRVKPKAGASGLQITVDTTVILQFDGNYQGRRVVVRNNGPDTLYFPAQDSRLYMKTQAQRNGTFADIEYLPSSDCGNSYHTLFLASGEQWAFVMPNYEGPQATRLRVELEYRHGARTDVREMVYSHTFPGSVSKGQFTEKPGYEPRGIMDPYRD